MTKRLAIFGGSFNPPGLHHRAIAETLARQFDEVVVVPCGPRPDKPTTNDVEPVDRAAMVDLTFAGVPRVRVELFDLEQATFTRTHELDERFRAEADVWHVVGTDLTRGGGTGESFIQRVWERGQEVWKRLQFAVMTREGYPVDPSDLPPRHELVRVPESGASASIRERAFKHEPIEGLVTPGVASYVERYGLYRGASALRAAPFSVARPRLLLVADDRNPEAVEVADRFRSLENPREPNCILVVGGDGTMLHAIRRHWRLRLPFLGVNAGHRGFLLNGSAELREGKWPAACLLVRRCPLLYVETGPGRAALAFNDAWVERAGPQTAWVEVKVNDEVKLSRLVADGVLVSTAAGSTAYARAMGATPLLVETPALILVGSNVMEPPHWSDVLLSSDTRVEFRALLPEKRPLLGFADGVPQGTVERMRIRMSRIASAELAFCQGHDMAQKIAEIQFPVAG